MVVALTLTLASPAGAFSLLPDVRSGRADVDLAGATRWSAGAADPAGFDATLSDGIQVAVEETFAEELGATIAEGAIVRDTIIAALRAWQTPELRFDIDFSRVPVEGVGRPQDGFELDIFAVPGTHPVFGGLVFFGIVQVNWASGLDVLWTNGELGTGFRTLKADLFINIDTVGALTQFLPAAMRPAALQRLLMHEIGHTLGFGHPNTPEVGQANYDTDGDPFNVMRIDPRMPFAGVDYSENRSELAIMSNRREAHRAIFFTELQDDDRGGRDVLYPSTVRCGGDCDGNGETTVDELVQSIGIALGEAEIDRCFRADRDDSDSLTVDEILAGVQTALEGCAPITVVPAPRAHPRSAAEVETFVSTIGCR